MSRIGKQPVSVPSGVNVDLAGQEVKVNGPKGALSLVLVDEIEATREDGKIVIRPRHESRRGRAMWGLQRTLVNNMIRGVTDGFTETLEINGVGYRAAVQGKDLVLTLGYSHEIRYPIPDSITIKAATPTNIQISGMDKREVGQVAAEIRSYRKPEPYKGKGIKYAAEKILRKEGKKK